MVTTWGVFNKKSTRSCARAAAGGSERGNSLVHFTLVLFCSMIRNKVDGERKRKGDRERKRERGEKERGDDVYIDNVTRVCVCLCV